MAPLHPFRSGWKEHRRRYNLGTLREKADMQERPVVAMPEWRDGLTEFA